MGEMTYLTLGHQDVSIGGFKESSPGGRQRHYSLLSMRELLAWLSLNARRTNGDRGSQVLGAGPQTTLISLLEYS